MFEDSPDVFAEMDELFDHLFSKVSGNFGMPARGFSSPSIPQEEYAEEPADPVPLGETGGQFLEPVAEVFRDQDGTRIVVELPGVTEDNLNLALRRGELIIEAVNGDCMFHTHTPVPKESDTSMMSHSLKNGVLEVTVGTRAGFAAKAG